MYSRRIGLILALGIPVAMLIFMDLGGNHSATRMAAVAAMMSILWVTEAIPLAATALLPLGLFPLLGIASSKSVGSQYMNSTVFLLVGGFMIALAMQRWNLHKRIALNVISVCGSKPTMLLIGFIIATAGLSMWISNTATTLVMLPIALAILSRYEVTLSEEEGRRFAVGLLLSIAYSASIGGMMTLVGTAPNLVFARFYEGIEGKTVGFAQWMLFAIPVGSVMLTGLAMLICGVFLKNLPASNQLRKVVIDEKSRLGRMTREEWIVLLVFTITAMLWITREGIHLGDFSLIGWKQMVAFGALIDDGSIAVTMAVFMFFIPARTSEGKRTTILDDDVFLKLPWSVVLLFGGGFALAYGFTESGLSAKLASELEGLKEAGLPLMVFSVTAGMTMLTELTSNTATTQLVLPILMSVAKVFEVSPVMLMLPATLSASCAFMFPVATPPNAIIFGSGKLRVIDMVFMGIFLNALAIVSISVMSYWLVPVVFNV